MTAHAVLRHRPTLAELRICDLVAAITRKSGELGRVGRLPACIEAWAETEREAAAKAVREGGDIQTAGELLGQVLGALNALEAEGVTRGS